MKTNPDPERDDALLDAVLGDEGWQASSAAFKAEALGTFRTRQRQRRLTRWAACAAVVAVAGAGAMHWLGGPAPKPQEVAVIRPEPPKVAARPRYLSDAELLASFPAGSCFLAEVDGQKELIFLDPNVERTYVARPNPPSDRRP
jgi:hypothetical protein